MIGQGHHQFVCCPIHEEKGNQHIKQKINLFSAQGGDAIKNTCNVYQR